MATRRLVKWTLVMAAVATTIAAACHETTATEASSKLDTIIETLCIDNLTLEQALESIGKQGETCVFIDPRLDESTRQLTTGRLSMENMTTLDMVKRVADEFGLEVDTFSIAIRVTSPEIYQAEHSIARVYNISDMIDDIRDYPGIRVRLHGTIGADPPSIHDRLPETSDVEWDKFPLVDFQEIIESIRIMVLIENPEAEFLVIKGLLIVKTVPKMHQRLSRIFERFSDAK